MSNEKYIRKEIIDKSLKAGGWDVNNKMQVLEESELEVGSPDDVSEPLTPYQGKQFSNYVLLGKDGKTMAVVEAKKTSVDAAIGREQAIAKAFMDENIRGALYPELKKLKIWGTLSAEFKDTQILEAGLPETNSVSLPPEKIFQNLSFSHLAQLIEIEDSLKRTFYEIECY